MQIFNETPFLFAFIPGRLDFPKHSLSLIVKGTYDLSPAGRAVVAEPEERLLPTAEEPYPDDDEGTGSLRYDSDFAYFKPRADLLLVGTCHPPGGKATRCQVRFGVNQWSKALEISGDRGGALEAVQPFSHLALRYERSARSKDNPVGTSGVPNITAPGGGADPAGFGPLAPMWPSRLAKTGNFKGSYLAERWPWFPKDMDWGFFNAAPADMQVEGYLRGDEKLFFANLHPEHATYRSELPGIHPRCFVNEVQSAGRAGVDGVPAKLREVTMRLDTLWVDMDAERAVLVWRGFTPVKSEELEELNEIYICHENLADEPASFEACEAAFYERQAALGAPPAEETPVEDEAPEADAEMAAEMERLEKYIEDEIRSVGLDPATVGQQSEEQRQQEEEVLKKYGIEPDPEEEGPLTPKDVEARHAKGESFDELVLSGLDLSDLDLSGASFRYAQLEGTVLESATLTGADFTEANLGGADLSWSELQDVCLRGATLAEAKLTSANLQNAKLEETSLEHARCRGAKLDGCDATRADFSDAQLTEASLRGAKLERADFTRANLERADLRDADIRDATMEAVMAAEVNMEGASLAGLRASAASDFSRANFNRVDAPGSVWESSKLVEASFAAANLREADFTACQLDKAQLTASECSEARFSKSLLRGARMMYINSYEGLFDKANLTAADLTGANLYGSEFLDAVLEGTTLASANLKMTKLAGRKEI